MGVEEPWVLVRPTGRLQIMFNLYNEFGAQSNLVSVATYDNADGESVLRPAVLFPAFRRLINQHYALGIVAVDRPSDRDKKKQIVWEARLKSLDLEKLIEYRDVTEAETDDGMHRIIEELHNEHFDPLVKTLPLWRVVVINGRHLIFIYDHLIADGLSSYSFQRSLLKELNTPSQLPEQISGNQSWVVSPPDLPPVADWHDNFPTRASIAYLIFITLFTKLTRALFRSWMMFSDAKINPTQDAYGDRYNKALRCKTTVYGLDLTASEQTPIVSACKKHGITYTALLHTLTIGTLATDVYPNSRMGKSSLTINIRRFALPALSLDVLTNAVATMDPNFWSLSNFRRAMRAPTSLSKPVPAAQLAAVDLDVAIVATISKRYTQDLKEGLDNYHHFRSTTAWHLVPEDKVGFHKTIFPSLSLVQAGRPMFSSLGNFVPASPTGDAEKDAWSITDIRFSAGATSSKYGTACPDFFITSIPGRACHISIAVETGVLPDSSMTTLVSRLKQRLMLFGEREGQAISHK